ncbi:MAG TPA: trehalose-phosphatase [Vicinamibacterales bacterium]|nr:trehalose-phosphatase [Vicinamibacterales bacterium]
MISPDEIAAAIVQRREGRHLLLLCDFDGTLCEFDPDPEAVRLDESRKILLTHLAALECCTVGIVSGRRLADVRARVGDVGEIYVSGFHGLEIEGPGASFVHPDAAASVAAMRAISSRAAPSLRRLPGVFIEDKGLSVALHYRDAEPANRVVAQSVFIDAARPNLDAGRVRLLSGSCVVELLPNIEWNKGSAVEWIIEQVSRAAGSVLPVYIGDDVTDADALEVVRPTGIGVAASDRVSADYRVDGPEEVAMLLAALDAELHC